MESKIQLPNKTDSDTYYKRYAKFVSEPKADFFRKFGLGIIMAKREGIYFYDANGKKYINCHCNGGVFNLGHRNPLIIQSIKEGLDLYDIGNHHLVSAPKSLLAEKLVESMKIPGAKKNELIAKVMFGVSGGEAIDLALKIAQGFTKRNTIVSLVGGYHGHTGLAVKTGDAKFLTPFNLQTDSNIQIPFGDMEAMEQALASKPAAILLETVPATLGMPIFSHEYIHRVRELCNQFGVTMILDEVQTGLSRTGKPWAFQHYGICPDIVVVGKGLSGGIYPITATCYRESYEKVFKKDPFIHISTFGGSEIGCYAGLKVIEIVNKPEFLNQVNKLSEIFKEQLNQLKKEFPRLTEIRQMGLFIGLVFQDSATCMVFLKILLNKGIFTVYAANDKRVLQFLPPLVSTESEVAEILRILRESLNELNGLKSSFLRLLVSLFVRDQNGK